MTSSSPAPIRHHHLAAQLAAIVPLSPTNASHNDGDDGSASIPKQKQFLDPTSLGIGIGDGSDQGGIHAGTHHHHAHSSGHNSHHGGSHGGPPMSRRRKAQRYRDLTCPRVRTSTLVDGTRIVTVGSHVVVYPPPQKHEDKTQQMLNAASQVKASAANTNDTTAPSTHPTSTTTAPTKTTAVGAITTFEPHSLSTFSDDSFKHYSLGVGLYFKSVKVLGVVFAICSLITIPSVILSILANTHGTDSGIYLERTSIGNFGSLLTINSTSDDIRGSLPSSLGREQIVFLLSCLDAFVCLLLLLFSYWLSTRQESEARTYSKREITVKKYSIEVSGLPANFHNRLKLAKWFSSRFGEVVDCSIAFDQHDLLDVYRERGIVRKDIDMAVSHGESSRLDHLYEQLKKIDQRIYLIQKDIGRRRTLGAYLTFEHQESRIACVEAFRNYWLKSALGKLKAQAAARRVDPEQSLLFGRAQRVLTVRQAPEPSNILFKNLKYSSNNKLIRRFTTFIATGILILVSVVTVYVAQKYQSSTPNSNEVCSSTITASEVNQDSTLTNCFCYNLGTADALGAKEKYGIDCSEYLYQYAVARALSILSVLTIVAVNFILKITIKTLTTFEKHHSLTRQQESITNKLFIGLFLNTAIVLLLVNMEFQNSVLGTKIILQGEYHDFVYAWFVSVGANIMLTMILNTLNPHLLPFMRIPWRYLRREVMCLPRKSDSQSLWNDRYSGDEFELAERYAVLLNTLFVTLLYSGGMPLLLPIAAITFLATYIMDKISFLRLYRIPPRFDHSLAMYTTTLLPYAIFLHLAFAMWFFTSSVVHETSLVEEVSSSSSSSTTSSDDSSTTQTISSYHYQTFMTRISHWSTLPVLILLILTTVGLFLSRFLYSFVFQVCRSPESTLHSNEHNLNLDASKFISYSIAKKTVTLETYHPHGSPYYHSAFIRTSSRKQLKIPTPLKVLEEQERLQELKKIQEQTKERPQAPKVNVQQQMKQGGLFDEGINLINAASPPLTMPSSSVTASPAHPKGIRIDITADSDSDMDEHDLLTHRAVSMGVDPHRDMRGTEEEHAVERDKAKNAAKEVGSRNVVQLLQQNQARFAAAAAGGSGSVVQMVAIGGEKAKVVQQQQSQHRGAAQKKKSKPGQKSHRSSSDQPLLPTHAASSSSTFDASQPIVILDVNSETAEHVQQDAEQAIQVRTRYDDADVDDDDDQDAEDQEGHETENETATDGDTEQQHSSRKKRRNHRRGGRQQQEEELERPYTSHLQHSAHISVPSVDIDADNDNNKQDPLLDLVQTQVHRLVSLTSFHGDHGTADIMPGEVEMERSKKASEKQQKKQKKEKKKKSKPASVHDSSHIPSLDDVMQMEVKLNDSNNEHSSSSSISATATTGDPLASSSSEPFAQLIPTACPNIACGRTIDLVDTGAPQLYHCPFCKTAFIM